MTGSAVPLLELRGVRKSFRSVEAVAGVSGHVARGEYVCVLGPSGCGKTTLLRMIAGFEEPSAGDIVLDGASLRGVPPERRDVNVVFQSYALFPHLTVHDNVAFGPRMKRVAPAEVSRRVGDALRLVRMEALGARWPRELSGGQQQRVALARALVNQPSLLLLDEPLSALDRSLRLEMQEELRKVQRESGVAFLHVTHDQGEALSLADRLVVMRGGLFEQVGSPRELYQRPRSRFVAEFLGSSNLLEGTVEEPGLVRTSGGLLLHVEDAFLPERVLLSVRPECVAVEMAPHAGASRATGGAAPADRFDGRIESASFTGASFDCRVAVGGHSLRATLRGRAGAADPKPGDAVIVHIPPGDVVRLELDEAPAHDAPPRARSRRALLVGERGPEVDG
jgi:spermidine/putrescine transport system ATP-binding protein